MGDFNLIDGEPRRDEPPPRPSLKVRAFDIGKDAALLRSYQRFQGEQWFPDNLPRQAWYWSANPRLPGATTRPSSLPTTPGMWNSLSSKQKIVLGGLGSFNADRMTPDATGLAAIAAAYAQWPVGRHAIFQGGGTAPTNTCNIYVGEALFRDGLDLRRADGKYYSAAEIWKGLVPELAPISPQRIADGDIAAWGGHVEIVTAIDPSTGHFCTVGGYRALPPMGTPKCGDRFPNTHSVSAAGLRFYRCQP